LVHGNTAKIVSGQEAGKIVEKTDGLITADKNLFLTITVADCLPIFIYDPEKEIIGLVHGGWKNLAKNILASVVEKMAENFGSLAKDILVGVGPGISQCHFEVKKDLLEEFKSYLKDTLLNKEGRLFLDLKKIAKIQLINLGVKEKNIETSPECTFCLADFKNIYLYNNESSRLDFIKASLAQRAGFLSEASRFLIPKESRFSSEARGSYKYFSYRRNRVKRVETMLTVIGRK